MSYKSDHESRTKLWQNVTRGLPENLTNGAHKHLGDNYQENKNDMKYDELLAAVTEFMSNYSNWYWNGQKWIEGD